MTPGIDDREAIQFAIAVLTLCLQSAAMLQDQMVVGPSGVSRIVELGTKPPGHRPPAHVHVALAAIVEQCCSLTWADKCHERMVSSAGAPSLLL